MGSYLAIARNDKETFVLTVYGRGQQGRKMAVRVEPAKEWARRGTAVY